MGGSGGPPARAPRPNERGLPRPCPDFDEPLVPSPSPGTCAGPIAWPPTRCGTPFCRTGPDRETVNRTRLPQTTRQRLGDGFMAAAIAAENLGQGGVWISGYRRWPHDPRAREIHGRGDRGPHTPLRAWSQRLKRLARGLGHKHKGSRQGQAGLPPCPDRPHPHRCPGPDHLGSGRANGDCHASGRTQHPERSTSLERGPSQRPGGSPSGDLSNPIPTPSATRMSPDPALGRCRLLESWVRDLDPGSAISTWR